MELKQLEYFCAIAKYESLTKAARKLHVSQPSLSRSLHALEDELGAELFDRVGRNIELNDVGRVALKRALATLDSASAIVEDVAEFQHEKDRSVNLYAPVSMADYERILIGFKQKYPGIHIRMGAVGTTYSERLKRYKPDLTFFARTIIHKDPNYVMLGEEELVVAVAKDHPLAKKDSVPLACLKGEPFISLLPCALYDVVYHMFLEAGYEPNVIIENQEFNGLMGYVARGFGFTIAPSITWFGGDWIDRVARIPISDVHRKRYLYLKWPENTVVNSAALRLREYLIEYFATQYHLVCPVSHNV
ncbi:MAG: LysR family transcriptional regulator [Eggerthellaceae bacterium]|jgi:LysR family transcriptional activator of glutamate synthase operon